MTIIYFIITLGVLIFIHEFGHFLMAKRAGVRVEVFSLGFGPKLFGIRRGETLYKISALPLGGYVKLTGEDPTSEEADHPKSFIRKSLWKRFTIVFAGPGMNLLLTLLIMPVVFWLGRPMPAYMERVPVVSEVIVGSAASEVGLKDGDRIIEVDGEETPTWSDLIQTVMLRPEETVSIVWQRDGKTQQKTVLLKTSDTTKAGTLGIEPAELARERPVIDGVQEGSAAATAGLQSGDRVTAVAGQRIQTWTQMSDLIQGSEGKPIHIGIAREGRLLNLKLTPEWNDSVDRYLVGVRKDANPFADDMIIKRYPVWQAIQQGTIECVRLTGLTLEVVGRLVTFQLSYKSLGGPVRIAQASASAAQSGAPNFLFFMAFLSLQLGILNLLPIPVLDGGHLFFMGIEAIRRKPVSPQVQGVAMQAGLFLLLFVMVLVTVNDVDSVWGISSLWEKIKNVF